MAATKLYKGNIIGTSKEEGLFKKLSDEGTELKLLKYQDFLPGIDRAPFVTHNIESGEPTERDSWWKLYVNTSELAVQRRIEDVKRITKFIASPKGVLWESERAALETIQKDMQQAQSNRIEKIRGEGGEKDSFWKRVLGVAANFGKSVLQGIGLTAATLEQTGVSGTGAHVTTYLTRAYLLNGKESKTFANILSYAGLTDDNNLNASAKIIGGDQTIDSMEPDPNRLMVSSDDERLVPNNQEASQSYGTEEIKPPITEFYEKNYRGEEISGSLFAARKNLHGVSTQTGSAYNMRQERMSDILSTVRKADKKQLGDLYGDYKEVNLTSDEGSSTKTVAKEFDQAEARYVLERGTGSYLGFVSNGPELKTTISGSDGKVRTVFADVPSSNLEYSRYSDSDLKLETKRQAGEGVAKKQELSFKVGYQEAKEGEVTIKRSRSREENTGTFDRMQGYLYHTTDKHYSYVIDSNLEFNSDKLKDTLSLIPFCITTITPDHRTYLNFPAYLDSYDDSYNGEWESVRYVGRAENFYGYKGFTRSINLSFKVIAFRQEHLVPLYQELNRLAGVTAPSYKDALFMRGTLASITIGELLRDKLGIIPSVKFSWAVDDPWEILKDGKQKEVIQVPHVLSVSLQFNPIEKEEVREDLGSYFVFDPNPRDFTSNPEASYTKAAEGTPVEEEKQRASLKGGKVESISENRTVDTVGTSIAGGAGGHVSGPSQYDIRANDYKNRRSSPDAISGTR